MTPSPEALREAREIINKIVKYSFIKPTGCEHVSDYPDFQTWRNLIVQALHEAEQRGIELAAQECDKEAKETSNIYEPRDCARRIRKLKNNPELLGGKSG